MFFSGFFLKLTKKGLSREIAYSIIQKNAMKAWSTKMSFYNVLKNDKKLMKKHGLGATLETKINGKCIRFCILLVKPMKYQ